jgi:heat shock protein HslJ
MEAWVNRFLVIATLLGLAGCATTPPPGGAPLAPYRATGQEPGWTATVADGRLDLSLDYGQRAITVAAPRLEVSGDTRRYTGSGSGRAVAMDVVARLCKDAMSGRNYPDRVTLMVGSEKFDGCGGDSVAVVEGAEWVVEDIGGRGIIDNSRVTMTFADGQVAGRAGCNQYGASVTQGGEGFTVGPVRSTRMACAPALMTQEALFLDIIGKAVRFDVADDGALSIEDAEGRRITARRG